MAEDLESLSHAQLYLMRDKTTDPAEQARLAPAEHQAFAREFSQESPLTALGLVAAIPAYQVAKATGLVGSRTGAGDPWAQLAAGYKGLGQGYLNLARRGLGALAARTPSAPTATAGFGAVKKEDYL